MQIDTQRVIDDLLEQNKQMTLQLSVARAMIAQLQEEIEKSKQTELPAKKTAS
jgi:hypothetical protein